MAKYWSGLFARKQQPLNKLENISYLKASRRHMKRHLTPVIMLITFSVHINVLIAEMTHISLVDTNHIPMLSTVDFKKRSPS